MMEILPRARATRRTATATTRAAGGRMMGPTRCRPHHHLHRRLLELLGVAGVGGPEKAKETGSRPSSRSTRTPTPSSRTAGPLPHLSALLPASSSPAFLRGGGRDVLLVSSIACALPRPSFCPPPPAILFCFLGRGTRKGLRASYLF